MIVKNSRVTVGAAKCYVNSSKDSNLITFSFKQLNIAVIINWTSLESTSKRELYGVIIIIIDVKVTTFSYLPP